MGLNIHKDGATNLDKLQMHNFIYWIQSSKTEHAKIGSPTNLQECGRMNWALFENFENTEKGQVFWLLTNVSIVLFWGIKTPLSLHLFSLYISSETWQDC